MTVEDFQERLADAEIEPFWLYRINISDTPEASGEADLFLAGQPVDIDYYRTDSGSDYAQTYQASGVKNSGFSQNLDGKIDGTKLTLSNISKEMQYYLDQRDGLRKRKVTIRLVDRTMLDDPAAYSEYVYYVDSAASNTGTISLVLKSRFDILRVKIPRRIVTKNYCSWCYKKEGCWPGDGAGGFTPPTWFSEKAFQISLGVSNDTGGGATPAIIEKRFRPLNLTNIDLLTGADYLEFQIRCSHPAKISTNQLELSSSGTNDSEEYHIDAIDTFGVIDTAWSTFQIPMNDIGWAAAGGAIDWSVVNYFRLYMYFTGAGPYTLTVQQIKMFLQQPYGFVPVTLDACNKTMRDCQRHNNVARFGGSPNVPSRNHIFLG